MPSSQAQLIIQWSEEKLKQLKIQLAGFWLKDIWDRNECPLVLEDTNWSYASYTNICFKCQSESLNTELKYAVWQKLQAGEWGTKAVWSRQANHIMWIVKWINEVAPDASSFMEKSLTEWKLSFRTYIVENGNLHRRKSKYLVASREIRFTEHDDPRLKTLGAVYKVLQEAYDDRPEYEKDIWDMRKLGVKSVEINSGYSLNFTSISQFWLRQAAKTYLKYCTATQSAGTCENKLTSLIHFSDFLNQKSQNFRSSEIDRSLIVEYLGYLVALKLGVGQKQREVYNLNEFLKLCARESWADVTDKCLIYKGDAPSSVESLPRYIPPEVVIQLNQHLDGLPPYMMRMVLILQETGRRISEVCRMPFNCLKQDASKDWFLVHKQSKMGKEDSIPISNELAAVIQEQQNFVMEEWGKGFPYLFPTPKPFGKGKPVTSKNFAITLKQLAFKNDICDSNGEIYQFQSHQFRHTLGTNMVNNGVPLHIIQRYLGHVSPEMTLRYAHIFDQTLKEEFVKFRNKMVDVTGKVMSYESVAAEIAYSADPNSIDGQWLKKNIRAQALPNGLCGLPANQPVCPYGANKCLAGPDGKGCSHFKTDIRYYDKHKEHLARTNEMVEWAQENPDSRRSQEVLKLNLPVKQNLERIITTLESQQNAQQ